MPAASHERLTLMRESMDLSKSELGKKAGTTYQTIHRYEHPPEHPEALPLRDSKYIARIAAALEVSAAYLACEDDEILERNRPAVVDFMRTTPMTKDEEERALHMDFGFAPDPDFLALWLSKRRRARRAGKDPDAPSEAAIAHTAAKEASAKKRGGHLKRR